MASSTDLPGLPPRLGKAPIPEGHVRLFHQSDPENTPAIKEEGLRADKGGKHGNPQGLWASSGGPWYRNTSHLHTHEFHVPIEHLTDGAEDTRHVRDGRTDPKQWEKEHHTVLLNRSIPPEHIVATHEPWHDRVRYFHENGMTDEVKAGDHDDVAEMDPEGYGKAIEHIKKHASGDGGLGDLTYKDDHRHQTGPGHVTYHVEVEHGRRRDDAVAPERGPVTPAYLQPADKSYIQIQVPSHGKTLDEMDQQAHKDAYDMASATSPHDMVTKTRILHVEAMGLRGPDYDNLTFHHDGNALLAHHPEHGEIGAVSYGVHPRGHVEIINLDVDPQHTRRGVATSLMREVERRHPGIPIDHGARSHDGANWAESYYPGHQHEMDDDGYHVSPTTWTLNGKPYRHVEASQGEDLPPAPGTSPVPHGHIRMWHYTHAQNVDSIKQNGLLERHARGDSGMGAGNEPSAGVWASTKAPDSEFLGRAAHVEFHVHPDQISGRAEEPWRPEDRTPEGFAEWGKGHHHVILKGDLHPSQILAVHEPWHQHARYIRENYPTHEERKSLDWVHDNPDMEEYSKALRHLDKHGSHTAVLREDVKFTDLGREPIDYGTEKHLRKFHEEIREDGSFKTLPIEHVHPAQNVVDRDDEHVRNPERDAEQPPVGQRLPNGHYKLMDGHHRFADALARGDSHFTFKTMTHGHGKCLTPNEGRCPFDWFMEDADARLNKHKTAARDDEEKGYRPGDDLSNHADGMIARHGEWMKTEEVARYRDHSGDQHRSSREVVDKIRQDLKPGGKGMNNALMLHYHPETHTAWLGEGNHRLKAAEEEGWSHVPVRVIRAYHSEPEYRPYKPVPTPQQTGPLAHDEYYRNQAKGFPEYMKPSEAFGPDAVRKTSGRSPGEEVVRTEVGRQRVHPVTLPNGRTTHLCPDHVEAEVAGHDHTTSFAYETGLLDEGERPASLSVGRAVSGNCEDCVRKSRHRITDMDERHRRNDSTRPRGMSPYQPSPPSITQSTAPFDPLRQSLNMMPSPGKGPLPIEPGKVWYRLHYKPKGWKQQDHTSAETGRGGFKEHTREKGLSALDDPHELHHYLTNMGWYSGAAIHEDWRPEHDHRHPDHDPSVHVQVGPKWDHQYDNPGDHSKLTDHVIVQFRGHHSTLGDVRDDLPPTADPNRKRFGISGEPLVHPHAKADRIEMPVHEFVRRLSETPKDKEPGSWHDQVHGQNNFSKHWVEHHGGDPLIPGSMLDKSQRDIHKMLHEVAPGSMSHEHDDPNEHDTHSAARSRIAVEDTRNRKEKYEDEVRQSWASKTAASRVVPSEHLDKMLTEHLGHGALEDHHDDDEDWRNGAVPKHVYRVMSLEHYHQSLRDGHHASDERNNYIGQAKNDPETWEDMTPDPEGTVAGRWVEPGYAHQGPSVAVKIRTHPHVGWEEHPDADDYIRTHKPIPVEHFEAVSKPFQGKPSKDGYQWHVWDHKPPLPRRTAVKTWFDIQRGAIGIAHSEPIYIADGVVRLGGFEVGDETGGPPFLHGHDHGQWVGAPLVDIDLTQPVYGTQGYLYRDKFVQLILNPHGDDYEGDYFDLFPLAATVGGQVWFMNGHHRTCSAKWRQDATIRGHLVDPVTLGWCTQQEAQAWADAHRGGSSERAEAGKGKARAPKDRSGAGAPQGDAQSGSGSGQQYGSEDLRGAPEGEGSVAAGWTHGPGAYGTGKKPGIFEEHNKVSSDIKKFSKADKAAVAEAQESLANGLRHKTTHPLPKTLPGWFSTKVGRGTGTIMVHRTHEDGHLYVGGVFTQHNYDEAERRLGHVQEGWEDEQGSMDGYRPPSWHDTLHETFHLQRHVEDLQEENDWTGGRGEEEHARQNGYQRSNIADFRRHFRESLRRLAEAPRLQCGVCRGDGKYRKWHPTMDETPEGAPCKNCDGAGSFHTATWDPMPDGPEQQASSAQYDKDKDYSAHSRRVLDIAKKAAPGTTLTRGEFRTSPDDPESVGMHWTANHNVVLPHYGAEGGKPVVYRATLDEKAKPIPRSHPMWFGRHRSMDSEAEVRLHPGSTVHVHGAFVWHGEGEPKSLPWPSAPHLTHGDWKYHPIERHVPVGYRGEGVTEYSEFGINREAMPSKKYAPPQGLTFHMHDHGPDALSKGWPTHSLSAHLGGEEVGTVHHTLDPSDKQTAYVDVLEVNPKHRSKGVGSALMDEMYKRYPDRVIDHGDRTSEGASWWSQYEDPHPDRSVETGNVVRSR